jgi:hypothetical protein
MLNGNMHVVDALHQTIMMSTVEPASMLSPTSSIAALSGLVRSTAQHIYHGVGHVLDNAPASALFGDNGGKIYWLAIHSNQLRGEPDCRRPTAPPPPVRHAQPLGAAPLFQEVPSTRTKDSGGVEPPHPLGISFRLLAVQACATSDARACLSRSVGN